MESLNIFSSVSEIRMIRLKRCFSYSSKHSSPASGIQFLKDLKYAPGVGHFDGASPSEPLIILPKMHHCINRTMFLNIEYDPNRSDYKHLRKRVNFGLKSKSEKAFFNDLPTLSQDDIAGPSYIKENGIRRVEPYFEVLKTKVMANKFPGQGISILSYFGLKFPKWPERYLKILLRNNHISVNASPVSEEYILTENDVISHCFHKHEAHVLDLPVKIIKEGKGLRMNDSEVCLIFTHNKLSFALFYSTEGFFN